MNDWKQAHAPSDLRIAIRFSSPTEEELLERLQRFEQFLRSLPGRRDAVEAVSLVIQLQARKGLDPSRGGLRLSFTPPYCHILGRCAMCPSQFSFSVLFRGMM